MKLFMLALILVIVVTLAIGGKAETGNQKKALCYTIHGRPRPCQGKRNSPELHKGSVRKIFDDFFKKHLIEELKKQISTEENHSSNVRSSTQGDMLPWEREFFIEDQEDSIELIV